jgi:hypothetical protein
LEEGLDFFIRHVNKIAAFHRCSPYIHSVSLFTISYLSCNYSGLLVACGSEVSSSGETCIVTHIYLYHIVFATANGIKASVSLDLQCIM